jgi:hypothetical protein
MHPQATGMQWNTFPSPFIIMETGDNSAGWPSKLKKHFKLPLPDTQHHECPSPKFHNLVVTPL